MLANLNKRPWRIPVHEIMVPLNKLFLGLSSSIKTLHFEIPGKFNYAIDRILDIDFARGLKSVALGKRDI